MPLEIDVTRVTAVLLADGWHYITPATFRVEQFSFEGAAATTGFTFLKTDQISREAQLFTGPLSSLLAVRHAPVMELHADDGPDDEED